jgi:ABC-type branched-subunit amino acid transport system ATPase component/branched-subunit amino acid ABC-type transport system permease component
LSQFLSYLIAGAVSGSFYALMASGLVLSYATSGVFNFSHGAIAFVSALLYYELNTGLHWPIVPAFIVVAFVVSPLLGFGLDRLMFRGLARQGGIAQITATVALAVGLPALGLWLVDGLIADFHFHLASTANVLSVPGLGPTPIDNFALPGGASINSDQVAALVAGVICATGLWLLTKRTSLGLKMRATVDQRSLASLRGVNPDRTSSLAWAVSASLAGITGVLVAPVIGLSAPNFTVLLLISAAAVVFAGMRSIPLAFAGGVLLGIVQDLVSGYVGPHVNIVGFGSAVPFVLLLIGLAIVRVRSSAAVRVVASIERSERPEQELPAWRRAGPWVVGWAALVIFTLAFAGSFWIGLIASAMCITLVFLSITLVTGIGGMVSLAQAAFVTIGGLVAGLCLAKGLPFDLALLVGVVSAAIMGAVVALPALRLSGVHFALATLALGLICDLVIFQIGWLANGDNGWIIPQPEVGSLKITTMKAFALLMFIVVGIVLLIVRNIERSPTGRAILAVRCTPIGAASSGISRTRACFALFTLSAAIAALGGVMYGSFNSLVTGSDYPTQIGMLWLAVAVAVGVRRPAYAVIAGLTYTIVPYLISLGTSNTELTTMLFGFAGVGLAKNPDGFVADISAQLKQLGSRLLDLSSELRRRTARIAVPEAAAAAGVSLAPAVVTAAPPQPQLAPAAAPTATVPAQAAGGQAAALELAGIRAGYGQLEVLRGISLSVVPGEILGLLGANGAGKSTLCSVIAGLIAPTAGKVFVAGSNATRLPPVWRSRNGVMVLPERHAIFAGLSVEDNLRLMLPLASDRDAVYEEFPALRERKSITAGLLSGGEQQILSMAPLLIVRPAVVIADEPSLGLAPLIAKATLGLLTKLRDLGVAVVLVDEKIRDIFEIADRVAVMRLGEIVWEGRPSETSAAAVASNYLGVAI